jgi:hypothetical protein
MCAGVPCSGSSGSGCIKIQGNNKSAEQLVLGDDNEVVILVCGSEWILESGRDIDGL